ncbi:protein adenylyltransferase SelO [Nitrobacter sp.]|uniref:protein adenylyltransferase SelO n=1 Tax=unclassified Nitrobacter TaxID=2620411 RepID=UPI002C3AF61B|nr:YdiU family protein [Nitrobacter sp.]
MSQLAEKSCVTPADAVAPIPFDNTYARMPEAFYERVKPAAVAAPKLLRVNDALARQLRIDPAFLKSPEGVAVLSGNGIAPGSDPIAQAYAGHQFGSFVPQLGDGRAVLLGEVVDAAGKRFDIQLKGSGQTRFSRRGDGRAALGPVIREYVVSEAMAALGIPTTRSLAVVLTGEQVMRERALPGGILTRVASSHLRVGTFQYFAARGDVENLRALADYAIARHYPDARSAEDPYLAFYDAVVAALARLSARWMLVGFIHGVLNTDNTAIGGETIDYGPCAFIDAYRPDKVFSSIDQFGRYAFENQPAAVGWNLARFAEALLPLIADGGEKAIERANASIAAFDDHFNAAYLAGMRRKLGLVREVEGDLELASDLLTRMAENGADFTLTFRALCGAAADAKGDAEVRGLFTDPAAFDEWAGRWRERLSLEEQPAGMRRSEMLSVNPMFIPRNHRIEAAIRDAEAGRFETFHELVEVLAHPFDDQPKFADYAKPPRPEEEVRQTFCGT